jgi:hypothetical protein
MPFRRGRKSFRELARKEEATVFERENTTGIFSHYLPKLFLWLFYNRYPSSYITWQHKIVVSLNSVCSNII